jgi:hypothetical protein
MSKTINANDVLRRMWFTEGVRSAGALWNESMPVFCSVEKSTQVNYQ